MTTRCGCSSPGILGCTCTLIDSACIDVSGAGSSASKYSLAPIISGTAENIISCGSGGLLASVSDATITRKVSKYSNSVTNNTETAMTYDTNRFASTTPLTWSAVTNPSRLTVPTGGAGKYLFLGFFQIAGAGSFVLGRASLRHNGANYRAGRGVPIHQSYSQHILVATVIDMADGDYMELMAFQDSGSTQTAFNATFEGVRLDKG